MFKLITYDKFMPDFSKDIHYISWTPSTAMSVSGYSSLSWVYAIVLEALHCDEKTLVDYFGKIDANGEVGTFWPEGNITIMPSLRHYKDEEIYAQFKDVMRCQQEKVRAKNLIFDMRYYCYFNPHTGRTDNEEYIRMLEHNNELYHIDADENWYVIIRSDEELVSHYPVAETDEVKALAKPL